MSDAMSLRNLNSESLGIGFAVTWFAVLLWCPIAIPVFLLESGLDFEMHILRLLMLGGLTVVYLVIQFFPFVVLNMKVKVTLFIVGVLVSPLPIIGNVIPEIGIYLSANPLLLYVFWTFAGLTAASMMLIWGYDMATKQSMNQGALNVSMGNVCTGVILILFSFLQENAAVILTMAMPFAALILWIVRMRRKAGEENSDDLDQSGHPIASSNLRVILGKGASSFIFSYGLIMGFAGANATYFAYMDYLYIYVGLSTMLAGVCMFVVVKYQLIKARKKLFLAFLPFSVACLFIFSLVNDVGKIICLFFIFFTIQSYNVMNTAYIGKSSSDKEFTKTLDFFNCESRTADMIGSAFGWALGTFILFVVSPAATLETYFFIVVVFVGITFYSYLRAEEVTPPVAQKNDGLRFVEWEQACDSIAARYRLSAREKEIFLLLSRGRDRPYIHNLLFISQSTVRSHAYNIYQKIGIHSQQELIDVVEEELMNRS